MNARQQWRYIAWTRAIDRRDHVSTFCLALARRLDSGDYRYPFACRMLDRLAGGIGPRPWP